ncbi:MAG TPA: hypothetical protein PKD53_33270, partial [Chloroflexaceae bacterium]|nr:hypothetical protein [Chloroflexaceae bacterium]
DATGADAYAAGNVSMGSAAVDSDRDAYPADTSIPRGDSYSVRGRDYSDTGRPGADTIGAQAGAEADAAGKDWEDSSKLGTVGGGLAGAATGAAVGAAGGPVGSVVGGVAGAVTGAGVGAAGDVAGERVEPAVGRDDDRRGPGAYDFHDDENLNDADRQVVDTSYTDIDRTGERVKDPEGFASGHSQPFDSNPAQFDEFAAQGEENFRTEQSTIHGEPGGVGPSRDPQRGDTPADRGYDAGATLGMGAAGASMHRRDEGTLGDPMPSDDDTMSESTRRSPHFAGADDMGGAVSGMRGGSGSEQPGAFSSTPGRQLSSDQRASLEGDTRNAGAGTSDQIGGGARIYDQSGRREELDTARAGHEEAIPAHGDFARGMRDERPDASEPDFARGQHDETAHGSHDDDLTPHHGDFARGMRSEAEPTQPDFARGQRGYELYDADYRTHYQSLTGSGGQPYDYYRPGYQFGHDLGSDESFRHDSWDSAERDARQRWEREARGSWEEFKQTIRYGWEKARGRA